MLFVCLPNTRRVSCYHSGEGCPDRRNAWGAYNRGKDHEKKWHYYVIIFNSGKILWIFALVCAEHHGVGWNLIIFSSEELFASGTFVMYI